MTSLQVFVKVWHIDIFFIYKIYQCAKLIWWSAVLNIVNKNIIIIGM